MSPSATRSASSPRRGQRGATLISVLALTGILAVIVAGSVALSRSATSGAARESRAEITVQAADAGVSQYISRLVEDPRYWDHYVDAAEDPRIDPTGTAHAPGSTWTPGTPWTYAVGSQTWTQVQGARFGTASFGLRITPPVAGSDVVTVQSTARTAQGNPDERRRSVQAQIHPTSIADFQMISKKTIKYGATATTTGKLYSAEDINHEGVATAPVYAQRLACSETGFFCGSSSASSSTGPFQAGAFDSTSSPSFDDIFRTPIDFNQFTQTRLDLKDAAEASGIARDDPSVSAWLLQFLADGRVKIFRGRSASEVGRLLSGLGCPETLDVPANGAMYFEQSVVIGNGDSITDDCGSSTGARDSIVNGRVTVATKGNVYVGGNIAYAGDDVLGLIAAQEVVITNYAPRDLSWRAATVAQAGKWRTNTGNPFPGDTAHESMTFIGAQATAEGGYASMFKRREYQYDENLRRIRPPFYPIIEGSWATRYWREVDPPG